MPEAAEPEADRPRLARLPWRRPPRMRADDGDGEERRVSWFELFCDLFFVASIAELGFTLRSDFTPERLVVYAAFFVPLWWLWVVYTFYFDRFDTDDLPHRAIVLVGMFGVALVAMSLPRALTSGGPAFVAGYLLARAMVVALYIRAARHVPAAGRLGRNFGAGSAVAACAWIAGLLLPGPGREVAWAVAVTIELSIPFVARVVVGGTPRHVSHLTERYGLFTIIVLGESVYGVVVGLSDARLDLAAGADAAACFVIAAGFWWIYFNLARAFAVPRSGFATLQVFAFGHLAIAIAIAAAGASAAETIQGRHPLSQAALSAGVALFLLACWTVRVSLDRRTDRVAVARAAAGVLAALLVPVGLLLPQVPTVFATALLLAGAALFEVWEAARPEPA
ncbi:MAG TPA: low temperature requirement protein A [Candidatus Dormibacteraeota bacterium]|jgi:low temperature requirement protein LtrA|nr:low temperature requirement protein A [Candidatus Dormibacteraeota bacterium]